jgi:hypothetical protein
MGHYLSDMLPDPVGKCATCAGWIYCWIPASQLALIRAWHGIGMRDACRCEMRAESEARNA